VTSETAVSNGADTAVSQSLLPVAEHVGNFFTAVIRRGGDDNLRLAVGNAGADGN